jgi:hypothetical protein
MARTQRDIDSSGSKSSRRTGHPPQLPFGAFSAVYVYNTFKYCELQHHGTRNRYRLRNNLGVVATPFLLYQLVDPGYMTKQEHQMSHGAHSHVTPRFATQIEAERSRENSSIQGECGVLGRRCPKLAALMLIAVLVPAGSSAQTRWRSATLQAGLAHGSTNFDGLGLSVAGEVGVFRDLRVVAQWTNWQALAGCSVQDDSSECNAHASLWELGLRQGLGVAPRVAPYVGAGFGLYRRRLGDQSPTYSPYISIGAGFDIRVGGLTIIRLSVVHQELFDDRIEQHYRSGVRFTGILLGIGLAVW